MADSLTGSDFKPLGSSDFKPVSAPTSEPSEGISSSDFKPLNSSDFKPSQTPHPTATPHTYDTHIINASKQYGLDPRVMQAIGMQESGLGSGGNYNPQTGRDRDSNQGVSPWQLDPASGLPKNVLDRAAKDPAYAARLSAEMMHRNLRSTNGNLREALSMYNSGSRTSPQGLAYADSVISRMERDEPLINHPTLITKLTHDVASVQRQLSHGKPIGNALANTQTLRPLHRLEVQGANSWNWARSHPIDAVMDVLGAPQRLVGGILHEAGTHPGGLDPHIYVQQLHHVWDMVFNPTEQNQRKATEGLGTALHTLTGHGIPTNSEITNFVRGHVQSTGALAPYITALAGASSDIAKQIVTDPTMVDGVGRGLIHAGLHASAAVARVAHTVASRMGIEHLFPHLPQIAQVHEGLRNVFQARTDLHRAGLTENGRRVRISLENRELNNIHHDTQAIHAAAQDPHASGVQYIRFVYEHGSAQRSAQAGAVLGLPRHPAPTSHLAVGDLGERLTQIFKMSPEEREKVLLRIRNTIGRKEVNKKTKQLIGSHAGLHTGNPTSIDSLHLNDNSPIIKALKTVEEHNPLSKLADLGKKSILWNPIPHGLVNVGTLTYMAGGIPAVMKGFKHMAGKEDPAILRRLQEMGGLSEYADTARTAVGKASNALLHKMEYGWRAGLLEELDKKLGKSDPGSVEELLKGHMVNNHIGDYRNQSAFVHMFRALGGPFVAFRLGIVPEQVLRTLRDNPSRITTPLRAETDIQENRQGKRKNTMTFGGPLEDAAKLATNPTGFLGSSLGALTSIPELADPTHKGLLDKGIELAQSYIPGLSDISKLTEVAEGTTMPGQKMSLVDQLMGAIEEEFLNIKFHKNPSPKQEKAERGRIRKGVTE